MCGIAGYWRENGRTDELTARRMAEEIRHRGPDDSGVWLDSPAGLALAHRRLSVIDTSPAGHQPMLSSCGRFVLVYNGEIYNHSDLRIELERKGGRIDWRGHSDTETLLAALQQWGVEEALKRLNGMFAFALWDRAERILFLARDRMGEKPLYYGMANGTFLFGSELKALAVHPVWCGKIDREALTLFLRHSYVPSPWSIYRGIFKLPAAHYLVVRNGGRQVQAPQCYWNLAQVALAGAGSPNGEKTAEHISELDGLLRDAVCRRMAADVPLGAFLSGGYDSTAVVALMQAQSDRPVRTFSIGFHEKGFDEAPYAKAVSEYLGTEHTELYISPEEAIGVIPDLPAIYDEPFSDSSQIPTCLVSRLARRHVTVSLSGDGGDELFYGYDRYGKGERIWGVLDRMPPAVNRAAARLLVRSPGRALEKAMAKFPRRFQVAHLADRLPKLAEIIGHNSAAAFYRDLLSHWKDPGGVVIDGREPETLFSDHDLLAEFNGLPELMMFLDEMTYLPDDILVKVDRASMAVSLEARVPLLDHRLVEFAWRMPAEYRHRDGKGKWLLRQVLYRYVPRELMDRPKMGFRVPLDSWLRGPLRDWAEDLLDSKRLKEEGYFDPVPVRRMWVEHVEGKRRWHDYLWDVLMFQSWLESVNSGRSGRSSCEYN